jgi:hypothetical protein
MSLVSKASTYMSLACFRNLMQLLVNFWKTNWAPNDALLSNSNRLFWFVNHEGLQSFSHKNFITRRTLALRTRNMASWSSCCRFSVKTLSGLFASCCSLKSLRVRAWQNNAYASALCQQNYMTSPKRNICTIIQSETCKDNPMGIIYKFSSISTETLLTIRTIYTNGVIWKRIV